MNKGQSLFEVVVAIAISALVLGGIVSLATNSIRNSAYSKNQSLASGYAQQATEWLRGQRDSDIASFFDKAGPVGGTTTYCLSDSLAADLKSRNSVASSSSCIDTIINTGFIRWVTFSPTTKPSPSGGTLNLVEADVTVTWSDSQGLHKVTSATSFSDWRQR